MQSKRGAFLSSHCVSLLGTFGNIVEILDGLCETWLSGPC